MWNGFSGIIQIRILNRLLLLKTKILCEFRFADGEWMYNIHL